MTGMRNPVWVKLSPSPERTGLGDCPECDTSAAVPSRGQGGDSTARTGGKNSALGTAGFLTRSFGWVRKKQGETSTVLQMTGAKEPKGRQPGISVTARQEAVVVEGKLVQEPTEQISYSGMCSDKWEDYTCKRESDTAIYCCDLLLLKSYLLLHIISVNLN